MTLFSHLKVDTPCPVIYEKTDGSVAGHGAQSSDAARAVSVRLRRLTTRCALSSSSASAVRSAVATGVFTGREQQEFQAMSEYDHRDRRQACVVQPRIGLVGGARVNRGILCSSDSGQARPVAGVINIVQRLLSSQLLNSAVVICLLRRDASKQAVCRAGHRVAESSSTRVPA